METLINVIPNDKNGEAGKQIKYGKTEESKQSYAISGPLAAPFWKTIKMVLHNFEPEQRSVYVCIYDV